MLKLLNNYKISKKKNKCKTKMNNKKEKNDNNSKKKEQVIIKNSK